MFPLRRKLLALSLATCAAALCAAGGGAVPAAMGAAPAAGSWGTAIEVPGLAALNKGGIAGVESVSCGSPGNCVAGGDYEDRHGHQQGFVAVERHGRWGTAIEVPGLAALNKGGNASVMSVSCASAGNCAAGGNYANHGGQGFVAVERRGRWGRAIEVPGLAALNKGANASVISVSCASAGNCAAGGQYGYNGSGRSKGFVVTERSGRWGRAIRVPGLGTLNTGRFASVDSVSCGSAGNCAAGGTYRDRHGHQQGFVADEQNGVWRTAIEVPGLGALNKGGNAFVDSVSCASAGNCAAGGQYSYQGFVAVEANGAWRTAIKVPGLRALNTGFGAEVLSVSCASPGNCAAGGYYTAALTGQQGFVAVERDGAWGTAIKVPGLRALNTGGGASVNSVSCASPGNCAAGGQYTLGPGPNQGFVADEANGVWGKAIEVPGLGALNKGGGAAVHSVSCAPAGTCAAGGSYTDRRGHFQGFVVSQTG